MFVGFLVSVALGPNEHHKLRLKVIYLLMLASLPLHNSSWVFILQKPCFRGLSEDCRSRLGETAQPCCTSALHASPDMRPSWGVRGNPRKSRHLFPFIILAEECHGESQDWEVFHGGEEDSGQRGTFFSNILAA